MGSLFRQAISFTRVGLNINCTPILNQFTNVLLLISCVLYMSVEILLLLEKQFKPQCVQEECK